MDTLLLVFIALVLVALNSFFVAAEYALLKIKQSKIDSLINQEKAFSRLVRMQSKNLEESISTCQLGKILASLALGWIGVTAVAELLENKVLSLGVESSSFVTILSFYITFLFIASLQLILGEQIPKVVGVTRSANVAFFCALPLKIFTILFSPFIRIFNAISKSLLKMFGISEFVDFERAHTEEELRSLMGKAHLQGQLTRTEHRLINAVFEFDDRVVREIMIPKKDVIFLESDESPKKLLELVKSSKHSRYPFGHGSLDEVEGVLHIKDLVGHDIEDLDLRSLLRPPHKVPEGLEISKLLRQFQATKQHMAFVLDEFGNVIGAVTMENVLEQIVGEVQDEFDLEDPEIVPEESGVFVVDGGISLEDLEKSLNFDLGETEADTLSGFMTFKLEQLPKEGDEVDLGEYQAEVIQVIDSCAEKVRITKKVKES